MKIYFMGMCGVMMAPLAVAMQKQGHVVLGSDKGFYPPISDYLRDNNITLYAGYKPDHIKNDIDMVVVAAAILPNNPELLKVKELGIKYYMGYGAFIGEYIVKKESVVCVGTYGKTTITAFLSYLLTCARLDPSFAIGGLPKNFPDGVKNGEGDWSVVEGDEYINARTDLIPRFLYYHPKYFVINAAKYDHQDVYPTEESYIQAYKDGIASLANGGCVCANMDGENIEKVLEDMSDTIHVIAVGTSPEGHETVDVRFSSYAYENEYTVFSIKLKDGTTKTYKTKVLGLHNIKNMVMGIALAIYLGIDDDSIQKATLGFAGVKRRLEIRREVPFLVIDDLAHSAIKAKASIQSIKDRFPTRRLVALFEPHTLASKMQSSLSLYPHTFDAADIVLIAPIYHVQTIKEDERISLQDLEKAIGNNAKGFDTFSAMKEYMWSIIEKDDILLFMSSGNFGTLIDQFASFPYVGRQGE